MRDSITSEYLDFLQASPTSFHAAHEVARQLQLAGFSAVDPTAAWPAKPGGYYLLEEGAILAWKIPSSTASSFSVYGAHTDSPGFKLKPTPQATTTDGWGQLLVEVYGGPLYNSWLDRELEVAGVIYTRSGDTRLVRTGPIARIPQLAIHLDRSANQSLSLDPQNHLQPVWTVDRPDSDIRNLIAEHAGVKVSDILGADLFCVPTQKPELFGDVTQFIAAGRQDNLSSVFAGLHGLASVEDSQLRHIPIVAFFDHEEVGSSSRTGAAGPLLEVVMQRTAEALDFDYHRAIAASFLISADAGHSVHPNYPGVHDPHEHPMLGRGPVAKINANQRYATTGKGLALWNTVSEDAGVSTQSFVSRNDVPCGSTIGPISSTRTGLTTVDVGIPMLSMHSAREMTHVDDIASLSSIARHFLSR